MGGHLIWEPSGVQEAAPHSPGASTKNGRGQGASHREDLEHVELGGVTLPSSVRGHRHRDVFQVLRKQQDEEDGSETETSHGQSGTLGLY